MDYIFTCGCGDTDQFAKDAFRLIFPHKDMPPIRHSPETINLKRYEMYPKAIAKSEQKFAYYLSAEGIWDLLKGVQVA